MAPSRHREPGQEERRAPPSWHGSGTGRRVLVEHRNPYLGGILERRLRANGYRAVMCSGSDDETVCPLLRQEPCPAVDHADAIVSCLDFRNEENRAIVTRIAQARDGCPLFLGAPGWVVEDWDPPIDFEHLPRATAPGILRRLDDALESPTEV